MGRSMLKKHHNVYEEHVYYIINDIHKPFKMLIFDYAEHVSYIFELAKFLTPPSKNN